MIVFLIVATGPNFALEKAILEPRWSVAQDPSLTSFSHNVVSST